MRLFTLGFITASGLFAVGVSTFYLFRDWSTLYQHYSRFVHLAQSSADMRALFIVETQQNAFRLNCFAEGVGVLLGAILAAVGMHGLCLINGNIRTAND